MHFSTPFAGRLLRAPSRRRLSAKHALHTRRSRLVVLETGGGDGLGIQEREAHQAAKVGAERKLRGDDDAKAKHDSPARKRTISGSGDDAA